MMWFQSIHNKIRFGINRLRNKLFPEPKEFTVEQDDFCYYCEDVEPDPPAATDDFADDEEIDSAFDWR
jgi:hypothetical protein